MPSRHIPRIAALLKTCLNIINSFVTVLSGLVATPTVLATVVKEAGQLHEAPQGRADPASLAEAVKEVEGLTGLVRPRLASQPPSPP
jgi:hypothetical protein